MRGFLGVLEKVSRKIREVIEIIYICDALMGSGKTMAAINLMNENRDQRYAFVTQFLSEAKRIKTSCPEKKFAEPTQLGDGKLAHIRSLFEHGRNIASTHALFYRYDDDILASVKKWKYTLILDEVIDVIDFMDVTSDDINKMLETSTIAVDPETKHVTWLHEGYVGTWSPFKTQIETSYVTCEDGRLFVWMLPVELFTAFENVIILTYMFKAQLQYYYFLANRVDAKYWGVEKSAGQYRFVDDPSKVQKIVIPPIHIIDDEKLNEIGEKKTNLSSTWFTNQMNAAGKPQIERLKKNLYNVFAYWWHVKSGDILWSTYNKAEKALRGNGYTKSFLSFNARAMNEYRDRRYLAYAVNIFTSPDVSIYFNKRGFKIDDDAYALSTMLQWLWRSAIRDGNEIWLYLPSRRMRTLLLNWLEEQ